MHNRVKSASRYPLGRTARGLKKLQACKYCKNRKNNKTITLRH